MLSPSRPDLLALLLAAGALALRLDLGSDLLMTALRLLLLLNLVLPPVFILDSKRLYLIRAAAALTPRALPTSLKSIYHNLSVTEA